MNKQLNSSLVSLVVPVYNQRNTIINVIRNFLKTRYKNIEIIAVDDRSTDGTYERLIKMSESVEKLKVYRNLENKGPSSTRNHGIAMATGQYIGFLETDMKVDPDWLGLLVDKIEKDKRLGAVQSKVLGLNNKNYIAAVGVKYDPHTFFVHSIGLATHKDNINTSEYVSIGAVGSLVRKKALDRIGGFDEKMIHNIDDIDLGWRLWIAGYKIITVPESITYHWTSKPANIRSKIISSYKSELHTHKIPRVFIKNYETQNIIKYLPWFFFIYGIRAVKNLMRGNINPIRGMIVATLLNIMMIPDTLKQRKTIQALRRISDDEILKEIFLQGNVFQIYYGTIKPACDRVNKVFG